jgi:hypothetical protein
MVEKESNQSFRNPDKMKDYTTVQLSIQMMAFTVRMRDLIGLFSSIIFGVYCLASYMERLLLRNDWFYEF